MPTHSDPIAARLLALADVLGKDHYATLQYIKQNFGVALEPPPAGTPVTSDAKLATEMVRYRAENKLTQAELAAKTGLPLHRLSDVEQGRRRPSHPDFKAIATEIGYEGEYVRVSGSRVRRGKGVAEQGALHEADSIHHRRSELGAALAAAIRAYKLTEGSTNADLARRLGVSTPTIASWVERTRLPRHASFVKIATHIGFTGTYVFMPQAARRVGIWNREILAEYLDDYSVEAHELAEALGVTDEAVDGWAYGRRSPPPSISKKLMDLTNAVITFDQLTQ